MLSVSKKYDTMEKRSQSTYMNMRDKKYPSPGSGGVVREIVMDRLQLAGDIDLNEKLGQHFLIDDEALNLLAQNVNPGSTVIEIGPGVGQLTDVLARNAGKVIAIEIDRRYQAVLDQTVKDHPNVEVIFGDALAVRFEDFFPKKKKDNGEQLQIVASLPYHITEPFLHKIVGLPFESVSLMVGQRLAKAAQATNEDSPYFAQLSVLTQTFFDIEILAEVEREKFFPVPRTDSAIIKLVPKEESEFRSNKRNFLLRRLFLTARRSPLIKNALKEGLIDFSQASQIGTRSKKEHNSRVRSSVKTDLRQAITNYNHPDGSQPNSEDIFRKSKQLTQNQAREIIENAELSEDILDKPFDQLNNSQLRDLSLALRKLS